MAEEHGDIERHRKHLAEVSEEFITRQSERFRIPREALAEGLPVVCISAEISDKYAKWRRWVHPLDVRSLEDLKDWFGVTNESALKAMSEKRSPEVPATLRRLARVDVRHVPEKSFEFGRLEPEQMSSVKQLATNLLYGFVDPEAASEPRTAAVIEYMIDRTRAADPKIFVCPDLIVCPDEVVEFQGLPSLLFNNVLIYGNGQIRTKSHTKLNANQIKHVDA